MGHDFHSPADLWIETVSIRDPDDPMVGHDFRGYGKNMEDTGVKKLSVDFSQDDDLARAPDLDRGAPHSGLSRQAGESGSRTGRIERRFSV
jgi:hypothetical protein